LAAKGKTPWVEPSEQWSDEEYSLLPKLENLSVSEDASDLRPRYIPPVWEDVEPNPYLANMPRNLTESNMVEHTISTAEPVAGFQTGGAFKAPPVPDWIWCSHCDARCPLVHDEAWCRHPCIWCNAPAHIYGGSKTAWPTYPEYFEGCDPEQIDEFLVTQGYDPEECVYRN
jgi:hypothetical protein